MSNRLPGCSTVTVCDHCDSNAEWDSSYPSCPSCGVQWSDQDGSDPEFINPDTPVCGEDINGSEVKAGVEAYYESTRPGFYQLEWYSCPLPAGHASDHLCGYDLNVREEARK